ncbi:hypothetical protein M2451_004015 [Dysgonomonas sp. PFB1-18]|uniref:hypothetical protein n=1 Tax=unclassified Dysgonomonas TaxID=2630389 RepID=UPI002476A5C0|nr:MULTISPECIES: hypothetical protein [unclassified Dysgonomonas]MDH6310479.1 hypothetical protein [Dysgonomonas sp. PF1-14]MDH6340917.1 hypothetical protein [Dysgonomonas sp. PF1-16]MDH6382668.1 hypothetical protein [Dysgonomonas sp. PFB1-18]MDH6399888.1 hypothetical protein [Dysgonomonas sp. PF1-23]
METNTLIQDFENINFHDCKVYAIGFNDETNEFLMDIDYIAEWINREKKTFTFNICPATLVFENIWNLNIDISMNVNLTIDNIERCNPHTPRNIKYLPPSSIEYDWNIELLQGQISFKSIGLSLFQRKTTLLSDKQFFTVGERGGVSLEREGICISYF